MVTVRQVVIGAVLNGLVMVTDGVCGDCPSGGDWCRAERTGDGREGRQHLGPGDAGRPPLHSHHDRIGTLSRAAGELEASKAV